MWPSEHPPVAAGAAAGRRNISIRPTRLGLCTAATVCLLWLAGLNYQANLAYAAAFWLAGFCGVSLLLNLRQLTGLRIRVQVPSEIFAGQTADISLLQAEGARPRRLWASFCGKNPSWLPWHTGSGSCRLKLSAPLRGYLALPDIRCAATAPFGLSMAEAVFSFDTRILVYPAPLPHETPARSASGGEAAPQPRSAAGGDTLSHLNEHRPGAPLHHIAWKTYAKTGRLLDKQFETALSARPDLVISYRDYPAASAAHLAGWLCHRVLEAENGRRPYILELPHRTVAPQNGQRQICLTALALW